MNTNTIQSIEPTIHSFGITSGASLPIDLLQGGQNQPCDSADVYWQVPESQFMDSMANLFVAY